MGINPGGGTDHAVQALDANKSDSAVNDTAVKEQSEIFDYSKPGPSTSRRFSKETQSTLFPRSEEKNQFEMGQASSNDKVVHVELDDEVNLY